MIFDAIMQQVCTTSAKIDEQIAQSATRMHGIPRMQSKGSVAICCIAEISANQLYVVNINTLFNVFVDALAATNHKQHSCKYQHLWFRGQSPRTRGVSPASHQR